MALLVVPAGASAASCPVSPGNATAWIGGSGDIGDSGNWSNGTPTSSCDVTITPAGSPTISMTGGVNVKSLVLGGPGSTPQLVISAQSANTNLDAQPAGATIAAGASVTLTCPGSPSGCLGGASGGAGFYTGSSPLNNAGTIRVDPNSGTGAVVGGAITNTGTITVENTGTIPFEKTTALSGVIVNQGAIDISSGAVAVNSGSSCGDTGASVKNDTGGTITANGTGLLSVINYQHGNGSIGGTSAVPVNVPCGTIKFTGNGTGKVQATGGFTLTGELQPSQSLTVLSQSNNTNATLGGSFTNKGSITLSCSPPAGPPPPATGCNGGDAGGAGFDVNDEDFVNSGTFTVAAASGTGANISANSEGTITNTGTMQFDQSAALGGPVTNQGTISIANGKSVTSGGGCAGGPLKNDTGGSINGSGTGTLFVGNYEQGNGTTTGANPVQMGGGCLKYSSTSGVGASKVLVTGGFNLTGDIQAAQSLIVFAQSNNTNAVLQGDLNNKGAITLSCEAGGCNGGASGGAGFNIAGHAFTNSGTFTVASASGTGANIDSGNGGSITNTGTMQFDQEAHLSGAVLNKGAINIADGKAVISGGGCGTGGPVKNDTGGSLNATGTGTLFVGNYEQGNGTTTGANPVQMGGGCLKYIGNGASKVLVTGGFDLSGEMHAGQSLTLTNNSANTNLRLVSPFTSKGSITFTCPSAPCNGPGFNGNGNVFTNAGTFTVAEAASAGTTLDMSSGGFTNSPTGTFQLNGNTTFSGGGPFSNQGTLQIVAGANTPTFTNAGTILLDQSATNPFLNTGTLTNTGTITTSGSSANASSINGTVDQTGPSAQVLVSSGTKLSLNNPLQLHAGRLSGTGAIQGSVENSGGAVAPGASPGTLTISNSYTQGAGGKLEIEIGGTGAGQFDQLAVGGSATLGGALALQPIGNYPTTSAVGDSLPFLTYGGTRTAEFASTTVTAALSCPKQLSTSYDDTGKKVNATVTSTGASCGGGGGGGGNGGGGGGGGGTPSPVPETKLGTHPGAKVTIKGKKLKVKFGFSSDVAGASFECKLDKAPFKACKSPKSYKVKPGKHKFQVRAVGPGGTDASPAGFSFKVVRQAKPQR